jgi:CRISPR-associated endonuclease Csn1
VAKKDYRDALLTRLQTFENDPKKAFGGKNSTAKNPIYTTKNIEVPEKVKLVALAPDYTIRKEISPDLKIEKVIDIGIRNILQNRLKEFSDNAKEAFVNLDKNPIWLNKAKGISIKRVTISGVNNAEALHVKKNHFGQIITDAEGKPIPADFVSTGNNHHVAIYRDENGNLQEEVVSFYEAVARVNAGIPIINKNHEKGWEFSFTMKQNEMFVFPAEDFDPNEIDLWNPLNYVLISPHLFRLQKIAPKDYWFRHHLETSVETKNELNNYTYKRIQNNSNLDGIIKVRINHIGRIVHFGEY